jgi:hypothetical protein
VAGTVHFFFLEHAMKHLIVAACAVAALAMPRPAAAQDHNGNSAKTDLRVSKSLVVGTTELTPGDYRFQCKLIDGRHYLVVETADGEAVTKVPCEPETLVEKVKISQFRSITRDGKQYLTAVLIKGETVAHRLAPGA